MKVGDKVVLLENIYFFKYNPRQNEKSEKILRGSKGDKDEIVDLLYDPFSRSTIVGLKNTHSDFIWDNQIQVYED